MERGRIAEATQIFSESSFAYPVRNSFAWHISSKSEQHRLQEIFGAVCNDGFGKRGRLNQKEPVVEGCSEFFADVLVERIGRHNVENGQFSEAVCMVESHPMSDAAAPIMSHNCEFLES